MLLAHIDKAGARYGTVGNTYSGSTTWHNSPRSRLALVQKQDEKLLELRHEKHNLSAKAAPVTLRWEGPVLVVAEDAQPGDAMDAKATKDADAEALLELVRIATETGTTLPAALAGSATAMHALEPFEEYSERFGEKDGRKRVKAAITRLLRKKRLQRVEYKDAHRNRRVRLEVVGTNANLHLGDGVE